MKTIHIIVEAGADQGLEIHVPPEGVRLGRSSKNDIVLADPLLSRHHCRIYFKPDKGLAVTDLGSSNKTMVNGMEIMEHNLKTGDVVQVGDTVMKVVKDGSAVAGPHSIVDLGLSPALKLTPKAKTTKQLGTGRLLIAASAVILIASAVWIPKFFNKENTPSTAAPATVKPPEKILSVDYEKVEADVNNIFRYKLKITAQNDITIEIDDLINNRTVRKEKKVDDSLIKDLVRYIENSNFFTLNQEYAGVLPDVFNQWDISITIDKKTLSVHVLNRPEPDIFKDVREKLEVFGKNELGLWAIQFSTEKLIAMAENEYLMGKKLFDEREVKYGNLAEAYSNFQKAEIDLETVEPKPVFYGDTVLCISNCKQLLQEKYEELYFQAERSIKLKEWDSAADKLRIIQEIIPERSDDRNKQARKDLLDVEERIKAGK